MNSGSSAKDIFLDAIEVKPEAREEYIGRSCGGNDALIAEVRALIREHDDACDFLRKSTVAAAAIAGETTGTVIGRYRLLGRLGEGGFGTVFMAEQREPVVRLVALKIIKAGMDTRQVIARFEAERQALALMDHPNIARVLDAGATEQGRPYFVMELVSGEPITSFCTRRRVAMRDRIELVTQVCLAVQHAHAKGVIHRDIKPGNILVSEQDGRPVARVIDFGIAKATDRRIAEQTAFTEHRHFVGTPEYMSPEQAAGSVDIDTRTDVYSLGVLLYELLTGCTPFDSRTLRAAAYGEIQRIILEEEPPKPSTRLSSIGGQASPETGATERLSRTVRGELDWIVMKSLEKDRARRYPTAIALADDLRRFLDGSPVEAAPPRASYRVAKFVRRNRAAVVGAAAIVGALASGLGAAVYGLSEAREQRDAARRAQTLEKEERLSAEVISGFMQNMFEAVNPSVARGRDTGVLREMVDAAAERVEKGELKNSPAAEVVLRIRLASVYRSLSQTDAAERLLFPVDHLLNASRPGDLVWRGKFLSERGALAGVRRNFDEKIRLGEELVDLRRKLYGDDHPDVADALSSVAVGFFEKGLLDEARARGLVALAAAERAGHAMTTAQVLSQLMAVEQARNALLQAARYGEQSVSTFKMHLKGEDHPQLARTLTTLVAVKGLIPGEELPAIALQREAIEMFRRLYPEGTPDLGNAINNLAWLLKNQNKLDEAEKAYTEALALERSYGSDREFSVAQVLINLGQLEAARGNTAKAEEWTRDALESCARAYPNGHYITGFAYIDLGRILRETGRLEESIGAYREALALHRRILGAKHAYCAISLNGIGEAHVGLNRHEAAVEPFRELLEIRKADKPEDPVAAAQLQLALALSGTGQLGDAKEAVELARAAVETRERILKADDWRIAYSRSVAGGALLAEARLGPTADRLVKAREAYSVLVASADELYVAREKLPAPVRKSLVGAACSRVIAACELLQSLDGTAALAETLERWVHRRLEIDGT